MLNELSPSIALPFIVIINLINSYYDLVLEETKDEKNRPPSKAYYITDTICFRHTLNLSKSESEEERRLSCANRYQAKLNELINSNYIYIHTQTHIHH